MKTYSTAFLITASSLLWAFSTNAQNYNARPSPSPSPDAVRGSGAPTAGTNPRSAPGPGAAPQPGVMGATPLPPGAGGPSSAREYAAAIWNEELSGDTATAQQAYLQLVAEFDAAREPAAETIYQLGEACRKLGRIEEARIQYARLLREFTDFPSLTQSAIARMAELPVQAARSLSTAQIDFTAPERNPVSSREIAGNPALRQLVIEDERLVEEQIAKTEMAIEQKTVAPMEIVPLKRELLRLKELLAAAEAEGQRLNDPPTPMAPQMSPASMPGQMGTANPDRETKIHALQEQLQKQEQDLQQSSMLYGFLDNSTHPETVSAEIVKDPRFARLKTDYEDTLAGERGADGKADPAAGDKARLTLRDWLKTIYLPELETSADFAQRQIAALKIQIGQAQMENHQPAQNLPGADSAIGGKETASADAVAARPEVKAPADQFETPIVAPAVAPGAPDRESNPRMGDTVAAIWTDGAYYIATITGMEGDRYEVLYGDGAKGAVEASGIIPIPAGTVINVGDHVLACWKGARMYPGVVTARTTQAYTVKWDDGDTPLEVDKEKVVIHRADPNPATGAGAF